MNEEFKKGFWNESGKMLVRGLVALFAAVLAIVGINTQTAIAWLNGLHFSDEAILWLRISACVVVFIAFVGCVAVFWKARNFPNS